MADKWALSASSIVTPSSGYPAGAMDLSGSLAATVPLSAKTLVDTTLTTNDWTPVELSGLTANVLHLSTSGGKVLARLTSADGSQQIVPVEPVFILVSKTVGITALDLQRPTGVQCACQTFAGQKA